MHRHVARSLSALAVGLTIGCIGVSVRRAPVTATAAVESFGVVSLVGDFKEEGEGEERKSVSFEVSYHNDTAHTFARVTSWCRALDAGGYQRGAIEWTLVRAFEGPIEPGFKTRAVRRIPVQGSEPIARVECGITDGLLEP